MSYNGSFLAMLLVSSSDRYALTGAYNSNTIFTESVFAIVLAILG